MGNATGELTITPRVTVQDIAPDPGEFAFEATSELVEMGVISAEEAAEMAADILMDFPE
jgi:hypothetical protein